MNIIGIVLLTCFLVGLTSIAASLIRQLYKRKKDLEDINQRLLRKLGSVKEAEGFVLEAEQRLKEADVREEELEKRIKVVSEELERSKELQKNGELLLQEKVKTIQELEERSRQVVLATDERSEEKERLQQELNTLCGEKGRMEEEVALLKEKLEELKRTSNAAIRSGRGDGEGREGINLDAKSRKLVELIEEIEESYPELRGDLEGIAWKKVWLPKMQDLVKRVGAEVSGIYKLTLKEDEGLVYIGQAVNVKERWYQHAKKLIGVMGKGGEKLYGGNWKPDDFWWEVLETGEGKKWLDEHERYWIEYFDATGGLNKK